MSTSSSISGGIDLGRISITGELNGKRIDLRRKMHRNRSITRVYKIRFQHQKESIPGGIEWMRPAPSSIIRSTLVEAISTSRSKRG
ncbi:hypothetical protein Tco_1042391 [Tanacetum coccineum]|uniref:Uncharacterized protein n=1 Tax=Tanacetum coccineum TaxID=301880 RepID=A0ABQ5GJA4_9ASTR